jgi:adenylate cyclase
MGLLHGIAAKIFGLAAFLLLLTIGLVGVLASQVADAEHELGVLREHEVPLLVAIATTEEAGLRRRLAFERWFGAMNASPPNEAIVAEASRNYDSYSGILAAALADLRSRVAAFPADAERRVALAEVDVLLAQLEAEYPQVTIRQAQMLELQRAGRHAEANQQVLLLNDLQNTVQRQRETLVRRVSGMAVEAAQSLEARQRTALRLTLAASLVTVLLGLAVAALVTLWLTAPVRALTGAVDAVRGGKLDTALPIRSRDEIGALTEAFNFFVDEMRAKEHIRRTFGRYVDPRVMEQVLKTGGEAVTAGERRRMTIQFADLVGFTELSERLTPSLMVRVLNRHFTLQAEAVQAQRGVVDKFLGDAVLAYWGPPFVDESQQVTLALRSVLAQIAAMETLRAELPELTGLRRDPPQISLRVGLATGDVLVGNIGSETACGYTVIGDAVNLASRIESINRLYGTHVLLGQVTAGAVEGQFELREIDAVAVKGKREATRLFELLGEVGQVPAARLRTREVYARGLAAYRAADLTSAEQAFRQCLAESPDDGPSQLMMKRISRFHVEPPPQGWDGTWVFDTK